MDGGGPEGAAKTAAYGDAGVPPAARGVGVRRQLFQCKEVYAEKENGDEISGPGVFAAGPSWRDWAGRLRGKPVL